MFIHYRTQGFILKKIDRGEANRLFTIYTKNFGKLELLAKAIRKIKSKLRGGLEIFYLSEIEFIQGKTHKTLTDVIPINNFPNIRNDLERLRIAYQISEVSDSLIKGQEQDQEIWELLNETFEKLNNYTLNPKTYTLIYYYFIWNFLSLLGYQLELYYCSLCQKKLIPESIYFSLREKCLICSRCRRKLKPESLLVFSPDTIKIIRILLEKDWATLKRLKIEIKDFDSLKIISNHCLAETLRQTE